MSSRRGSAAASTPRRRRFRSLFRLRSYLRLYRGQLLIMAFAAAASVGATIVVPLLSKAVIDGPVLSHQAGRLWPLAGLALALGLAEAALILVRRWVQARAVLHVETRLRNDLYAHLQRLPVAFHDTWQSGQLLSRATTDLSTIRRFLGFGLIYLVVYTLQYAVVIALLIGLYWPLGLLVALGTVPIVVSSARWERRFSAVSRQLQDQQGDLTTVVEEAAGGIRVVKAFGRRRLVGARFDTGASTVYATSMVKVRLAARFWTLLELIPNLTLVVVLLLGVLAVGQGGLTTGGLVAFITLQLQLVWPVEALGYILAMTQESMTAADRVYEVLDEPVRVVGGARVLERPRGALRFEGVAFRYPGADRDVLHDVWLDVAPGETVAVVGATGCGKSTLTALVPRLYDVTGGRITLDGVDVRELTLASLRSAVAVAFEEPTLFSASVRENVTLGFAGATERRVAEALSIAEAYFVDELPWGLDTRIGEQGLSLSGGQRQRLALARAVVGHPAVLVLDDPLSALDVHTEALVEAALVRVLAGTTGLLVAHRPSTLALADRVAFLDGGTITHVGRHGDLLATVPRYRAVLAQEADLLGAADRITASGASR